MEPHYTFTDTDFELEFGSCRLDPGIFTHEAHIRLAWICIRKYGEEEAISQVCTQLARYVDFLGARQKYNHTLTIAAVKAVSHFMRRSDAGSFEDFIADFPRLKYNFRALMQAHYQVDIFADEVAKTTYMEPDLLPFD